MTLARAKSATRITTTMISALAAGAVFTPLPAAAQTPVSGFLAAAPPASPCGAPSARTPALSGFVSPPAAPCPASAAQEMREHNAELGELHENLAEGFEVQAPTTGGQDLGGSLVGRFFGGAHQRQGHFVSSLGDALTATLFGGQLATDAALQRQLHLDGDYVLDVMAANGLAHGVAQGLSFVTPTSHRASLAFTSASLMCTHQQMAGGVALDRCAGGIAVAATVGAMRAFSDEHRFRDVAFGAGVGLLSGFLVPFATVYRFGRRDPLTAYASGGEPTRGGIDAWLSPSISTRGLGLRAAGTF